MSALSTQLDHKPQKGKYLGFSVYRIPGTRLLLNKHLVYERITNQTNNQTWQ